MILDQKQVGLSLRDISDDQVDQVRKWATQETPMGFLALNLLYLIGGEQYYEEIPVIEDGVSDNNEKQSEEESTEISFALIPNPSHAAVTVMLNSGAQDRMIETFDFVGKKIQKFTVAAEATSIIINTEAWHEGIYFFRVSTKNEISKSDKLVIIK